MSKELKNTADAIMDRIHQEKIKMRPRVFFVIGSILAFIGLVTSMITSVFLVGLMRFSLRTHGPMGKFRLDQLLSNFPWWMTMIAIIGLIIGIWLLRRYDFSYKIDFKMIIIGVVAAIIVSGWITDMTGLNNTLLHRGPMQGMMRQYFQENNFQPNQNFREHKDNR